MSLEDILRDLRPLEVADSAREFTGMTVYESLQKLIAVSEKLGKFEFRAAEASEFTARRLTEIAELFEQQVRAREEELRHERRRIGDLEETVEAVLGTVTELMDLVNSAADAARRDLGAEHVEHLARLLGELLKVCKKLGLEPTAAVGQRYDPDLHESIDEVDSSSIPAGHLAEVVRQGYRFRGRVVRIAKVVTAR